MTRQRRLVLLVGIVLVTGLFSLQLPADELEDRARKIAHQLRCPTCQGLSVKESEAGLSLNMKSKIRDLLREGKSEGEILEFFKERYGEWILRSPPQKGFNLILWLLPGVVISLATLLLFLHLKNRSLKRNKTTVTPLSETEKTLFDKDFKTILDD